MINFSQGEIELVTARSFNTALSRNHDWRFGRHGSFSVNPDKGVWFDHETGKGGLVSTLLGRRAEPMAPFDRAPTRMPSRWSARAAKLWGSAE